MEDEKPKKIKTVECICEFSGLHTDKIRALWCSFDAFIFSYNFSEDRNNISKGFYIDDNDTEIPTKMYLSVEKIPKFGSGKPILSGDTFERIFGILDTHGVFEYFEKFPSRMTTLISYIGIRKKKYHVYRMEYFLFHLWWINSTGVWGKFVSFFENEFPDGKIIAESLLFLLHSGGLDDKALLSEIPERCSSDKKEEIVRFGDIEFNFTEQTIYIGHSRPITGKDLEYTKSRNAPNDPKHDDYYAINLKDEEFIRGIKGLGALIKFGEEISGFSEVKVYSKGEEDLRSNTLEITTLLPDFMTKKIGTSDLEAAIGNAKKLLTEFKSNFTLDKMEQDERLRNNPDCMNNGVYSALAPRVKFSKRNIK